MRLIVFILALGFSQASASAAGPAQIGLDLAISKTPIRSTIIRLNGIDLPTEVTSQAQGTYYFVNGAVSSSHPRLERWCSIPSDDLSGISRLSGDYQVVGRFNIGGWSSTTRLILKSVTDSSPQLLRVSCQLGPLHVGQTFDAASLLYQFGGGTFTTQFGAYLYAKSEQKQDPVGASYSRLDSPNSPNRRACIDLIETALAAEQITVDPLDLNRSRPFCQDVSTEKLRISMKSSPEANPNCAQTHHLCDQNFPLGLPARAKFSDVRTTTAVENQRIYYVLPTIRWR